MVNSRAKPGLTRCADSPSCSAIAEILVGRTLVVARDTDLSPGEGDRLEGAMRGYANSELPEEFAKHVLDNFL